MRMCVCTCACVCVCVCVCVVSQVTSRTALQFVYMALAIDITDGNGLINEVHMVTVEEELYLPFLSQ